MSLRIEDDKLRKRRDDDYGMNVQQLNMPQPNGIQPGGGELSFADRYGTDSIFGVDPDQVQAPSFQTSGSQAGSSAGASLLPADNTSGGTFSLTDAVQMDNLPVASTATPVQTPDLSSGLTATGDTERDGAQGGATDNGSNRGGHPGFGAGDIMNITDGGLTSSNPRFALSPELPAFGTPTSPGDATLNPTPADTPAPDGAGNPDATDNPDGTDVPAENPDNVNDPANNGGIKEPDENNGAGETGENGTGKTPEQLAQEEAEKQAQLQQQKLLEEQRQQQLLQQQGGG